MNSIEVSFQHWRYVVPEEVLIRYGSPHFDKATAKRSLCECFREGASRVEIGNLHFQKDQIFCANEAFAEAAIADPLADLDVWDDWRYGYRRFPYPGSYANLDITNQEKKTSSPSSVGVIGEIMAGLFGQSCIGPMVLVRVVRRWPDLIFYTGGGTYSFLEAKAFTSDVAENPMFSGGILSRVTEPLLGECLLDAVQQLNADAFVKVWGSFTHIQSIRPMQFAVTFVELDAGHSRRAAQTKRVMPQAVLTGLAERALRAAAGRLSSSDIGTLVRRNDNRRKDVTDRLILSAADELNKVIHDLGMDNLESLNKEELKKEIQRQAKTATSAEEEGKWFFQAKQTAAQSAFASIRETGRGRLLMRDLTHEERMEMLRSWQPDWRQANRPYKDDPILPVWQFSGVAFAVARSDA